MFKLFFLLLSFLSVTLHATGNPEKPSNKAIALSLLQLDDVESQQLLDSVTQEAQENNLDVLLRYADYDTSLQQDHIQYFIDQGVVAIIIEPTTSLLDDAGLTTQTDIKFVYIRTKPKDPLGHISYIGPKEGEIIRIQAEQVKQLYEDESITVALLLDESKGQSNLYRSVFEETLPYLGGSDLLIHSTGKEDHQVRGILRQWEEQDQRFDVLVTDEMHIAMATVSEMNEKQIPIITVGDSPDLRYYIEKEWIYASVIEDFNRYGKEALALIQGTGEKKEIHLPLLLIQKQEED